MTRKVGFMQIRNAIRKIILSHPKHLVNLYRAKYLIISNPKHLVDFQPGIHVDFERLAYMLISLHICIFMPDNCVLVKLCMVNVQVKLLFKCGIFINILHFEYQFLNARDYCKSCKGTLEKIDPLFTIHILNPRLI